MELTLDDARPREGDSARPAADMAADVAGDVAGDSAAEREAGSVAILLCTYNGARFLPLQLASFETQDVVDWRLYVSDDGSKDETWALLEAFQKKHGAQRVQLRRGPGKGFVANFLSLICDPDLGGDYFALSDQDDVWTPDKLLRARRALAGVPADMAAVYGSRARLIDQDGAPIGMTPLFRKPLQFRHALVQNFTMGNTMVFNKKARDILIGLGAGVQPAVHDWWVYLVITAVGGMVLYDPTPTVDYRIHGRNQIGTNPDRVRRAKMLLARFKTWNDANIAALASVEPAMPEDNRKAFALFRRSRQASLLPRIYGLLRAGIYRETVRENIELALAALVGQI